MKKIIFAWLLGTFLLWAFPMQDRQERNEELIEIKNKINNIQKEKGSILNEIYRIELMYEKTVIERNDVSRKLVKIRQNIARNNSKKQKLQSAIHTSKGQIKKILRILFKTGRHTYLKLLIRINNFQELFKNYKLFTTLIEFKTDEIAKTRKNIAELILVRKTLDRQRENLVSLQAVKQRKLNELKAFKAEKINLLTRINNDKQRYIALLNELKLQAENLDSMITDKGKEYKIQKIEVGNLKGELIWPLKGEVISTYGKKKSKKFDTYTFNDGIEIKPSSSSEIKAVLDGVVVWADYFKGYGNLVVIQHSRDFYSLYGHCKKFLVKKGMVISKGELLGIVGDTGSRVGDSLYFGIRKQIKSQDPLQWLRKR